MNNFVETVEYICEQLGVTYQEKSVDKDLVDHYAEYTWWHFPSHTEIKNTINNNPGNKVISAFHMGDDYIISIEFLK